TLADHDVDLVVFERWIQNLLDDRRHPVDLVDEQHLAGLEIRHDAGEVARFLDGGTGRGLHLHTHFVRDDVRKRRLAEARRSVREDVIGRWGRLRGGGG